MNINSLIQSNISFVTHRAFVASPSHWLRAALPTVLVLALAPFATASDKHSERVSKTNETLFLELQQDIPSVDFVATPVIEEFIDPATNMPYFKVPLTLLQAGQYNVGLDGVLGITMKTP